jgi:hypothetical protein
MINFAISTSTSNATAQYLRFTYMINVSSVAQLASASDCYPCELIRRLKVRAFPGESFFFANSRGLSVLNTSYLFLLLECLNVSLYPPPIIGEIALLQF